MDLKDFIANSLTQIAEGILQASEALADTDAEINPINLHLYPSSSQVYGTTREPSEDRIKFKERHIERVSFDVAVTTEGSTTGKAGLKVGMLSVGVNAGGELTDKTGQASRIQFTIPMVFPSKRNGGDRQ
ncbi:hypothetical protein [Pseudomonas sp. CES]|uniref:hypothetical protein n=1 Tax=Pseudomonas sp. CES TaxID=2719586 RepID=UPI0014701775|nr:hypothetical protein [Pseudomonas sp. CES]KAF4558705.1 hypothetical protein HBJ16_003774 [Pseudomonas sp. CES]